MSKVQLFLLIVVTFLANPLSASASEGVSPAHVGLAAALPFVLLLALIATGPLFFKHWWEKNYPFVAFGLGLAVVAYYALWLQNIPRLVLTASEYISFISLIGSLFVVSSGIHLRIRGQATPWENVRLLTIASVIANLLGTTGASMLFIRPYLRMNKLHLRPYHVVFFIFTVSNIAGALTPIGDPPLFLGYLKGIPFFWVIGKIWPIWALTLGLILLIFYFLDRRNFRRLPKREQRAAEEEDEPRISGLHNLGLLAIILGAVFIQKPIMLREILMWSAAGTSYYLTRKHKPQVYHKNDFNFLPIKEVTILFAGIFATMIPAIDWLQLNADKIGIHSPGQFFFATGFLSSILDNAPTYLNFLTAAFGLHGASVDNFQHMQLMLGLAGPEALGLNNTLVSGAQAITAESWHYILAISAGAVFWGAVTYIGNGPNFMVKSIAEMAGVKCPTFFGYILKYALPVLIPVFVLVWLLFFSGFFPALS